ncbi:MAG: ATP-binding cassette domain-containing protein [Bacteroidales bacterium]
MLVVENLRRPGLQPVSFALADGECVSVRGPSGSGKSLLLRAVADLDPSEGRVSLDGVERTTITAPKWRAQVGYLPAEPGWWAEHARDHFHDWEAQQPLLRRLGLRDDLGDEPVARLSTGERQRLALVRALERRPRVLLLDEPTAALDPVTALEAEAILAELRRTGLSLLWVSHDPAQAARVASRHLVVEGGHVREVVA